MSIEITSNNELSINELSALQSDGVSVVRSPHVGNLQPYNMALAEAGIPLLLVDHTITGRDDSYFPEQVIANGRGEVVAETGRLVCAAETASGQPLIDLHIQALTDALPKAVAVTNSEFLKINREITEDVVALAGRRVPALFTRIAKDGQVVRRSFASDLIASAGVLQLNDDQSEGVILPNAVDIAIGFITEAIRTGNSRQIHVSGPAMQQYIGKDVDGIRSNIETIVREVQESASFAADLPRNILVEITNATSVTFGTTTTRQTGLAALVDCIEFVESEKTALNARRKDFFSGPSKADANVRGDFLSKAKAEEARLDELLAEQVERNLELFSTDKPEFLTQHDAAAEGGFVSANINKDLSFSALETIVKQVKKIRQRFEL